MQEVMSAETRASFIAVTMKALSINIKSPSLCVRIKERYQTLSNQAEGLSIPSSLLRSFSKRMEKALKKTCSELGTHILFL